MKNLLTIFLLSATTLAHGQSWEAGVMTGSRYCFSNSLLSGFSPHSIAPNENIGNNAVYLNWQKGRHISIEGSASYYKLVSAGSAEWTEYQNRYSTPLIITEQHSYSAFLTDKSLEYRLSVYYVFNNKYSGKKMINHIKSSFGLSASYLHSTESYDVHGFDDIRLEEKDSSIKTKGHNSFVGISYKANYPISKHITFNASVTLQLSIDDLNLGSGAYNFMPYSLSDYTYLPPPDYIVWCFGFGYKF